MNGWTRNSRFWRITPWVVLLSAVLAMYFKESSVFTGVTMVWMGLAGSKSIVSTYTGSEPVGRDGGEEQ